MTSTREAEQMPDFSRIVDLSQLNEPDFERAFIFFCRHLVSLSGTYRTTTAREESKEEYHFTFSGFIMEINGVWNFITAGHILSEFDDHVQQNRIQITRCELLDDFGPEIASETAVPFDYISSPKCFCDDDKAGLDFGLIALSPIYRQLLQANGVIPVVKENWVHQHKMQFDRYFLVGLPSLFLATERSRDTITRRMSVTIIPTTKIDTPQEHQKLFPRITGKIADDFPLDELDGMSGGPILGFTDDQKNMYWVVAVQSSWFRSQRIIFGCPIPVIAAVINQFISNNDITEPSTSSE